MGSDYIFLIILHLHGRTAGNRKKQGEGDTKCSNNQQHQPQRNFPSPFSLPFTPCWLNLAAHILATIIQWTNRSLFKLIRFVALRWLYASGARGQRRRIDHPVPRRSGVDGCRPIAVASPRVAVALRPPPLALLLRFWTLDFGEVSERCQLPRKRIGTMNLRVCEEGEEKEEEEDYESVVHGNLATAHALGP